MFSDSNLSITTQKQKLNKPKRWRQSLLKARNFENSSHKKDIFKIYKRLAAARTVYEKEVPLKKKNNYTKKNILRGNRISAYSPFPPKYVCNFICTICEVKISKFHRLLCLFRKLKSLLPKQQSYLLTNRVFFFFFKRGKAIEKNISIIRQ